MKIEWNYWIIRRFLFHLIFPLVSKFSNIIFFYFFQLISPSLGKYLEKFKQNGDVSFTFFFLLLITMFLRAFLLADG